MTVYFTMPRSGICSLDSIARMLPECGVLADLRQAIREGASIASRDREDEGILAQVQRRGWLFPRARGC